MSPAWVAACCSLLMVAGPTAIWAQSRGKMVRGIVRSQQTGAPISNVIVRAASLGLTVRTDTAGFFQLMGIGAHEFVIQFRRLGFAPLTLTVRLEDSVETTAFRRLCSYRDMHHLGLAPMNVPGPGRSAGLFAFVSLSVLACSGSARGRESGRGVQDVRDTVITATIPREGGTIDLTGVGRVIFARGTFDSAKSVTVATTFTPSTQTGRVTWDVSVGPPDPLLYDVRISFAGASPSRSFEVFLTVPDSYLRGLPAGLTPRMFARVLEGGRQEDLDLFRVLASSTYDAVSRTVHAVVPLGSIRLPESDGVRRVILLVAAR